MNLFEVLLIIIIGIIVLGSHMAGYNEGYRDGIDHMEEREEKK